MVRVVAACAIALAVVVPQSARGAVVFGADLSQAVSTPGGCAATAMSPCSYFTETRSDATAETGAPMAGALVSVRLRHYNPYAILVALRLFRPTDTPGEYLNVGPEIPMIVPQATTPGGEVTEYPMHRVIAAGDRIGLGFTKPTFTFGFVATGGPRTCRFRAGAGSDHPVDTAASYDTSGCVGEVLISGTVEPDADGDGFGDETQDGCPSSAAYQGDCPVPAAQGRDTRPPTLELGGSRRQDALAKRRVFVYVTSDEAARLSASGTISMPGAARALRLGYASTSVAAGSRTRLALKLGRNVVRQVRRALRSHVPVRARVAVVARDAAGNTSSAHRKIRITRGR
jgi:hypothetical protein